MPSIQSFTLTYNTLNEDGTFSEGDILTGKVTMIVSKQITAECLFVKAKGDASCRWSRKQGEHTHTYSAHRRFFKLKEFLIPEGSKDNVIPPGTHVYQFHLRIPPGGAPSSFRGNHGKIVYKLEAKLSRSWKMDCTAEREFHFASKAFRNIHSFMHQQIGSANKDMGFFSKGKLHMDVTINKKAYVPGEAIAIVAKINNSSSKEMTPKFSLIRDVAYHAQGSTKRESYTVLKVSEDRIQPQERKEVKCYLKIPKDLVLTIQNCDIISVEYHLKFYMDISFSFDPEVVFPVVICPSSVVAGSQPGVASFQAASDFPPVAGAMGPYPAWGYSGPSYSSQPAPMGAMGPYSYSGFSAPPPAYPAQPSPMSVHYNNPTPQQGQPYGKPFASPSSVLHPPPPAPTYPHSPSAPSHLYSPSAPTYPSPPSAPAYPYSPSAPTFSPTPSAPSVHPPPSAPTFQPPPGAPETSPTAPAYNLMSSMDANFLSQSDEAPPSYSLLFPSSDPERSDAK